MTTYSPGTREGESSASNGAEGRERVFFEIQTRRLVATVLTCGACVGAYSQSRNHKHNLHDELQAEEICRKISDLKVSRNDRRVRVTEKKGRGRFP